MAVTNNIDNSVLFCQRKISGFRSFEKIKKSFKYVFLVSIIVDRRFGQDGAYENVETTCNQTLLNYRTLRLFKYVLSMVLFFLISILIIFWLTL